jgi:CheY-like chemotaxis protein
MTYGKVLVVDDVPTNLDVARGLMLPYGLTIDFAGSGKEAIEKIRKEEILYDIVFMDHMMPDMDGIEATRIIRNEIGTKYSRTVPIIALTANALTGNREMFLANGFNDFLPKPIDIEQLDIILNQWVKDKYNLEIDYGVQKKSTESGILRGARVNGVDLAAGIARYNGEPVYLDILRSFVTHTPPSLLKLKSPTKDSLSDYATIVHGIKGASYGICAPEAGARAGVLEMAAKAGDLESVLSGNESFMKLIGTIVADLKAILGGGVNSVKARLPLPDPALLQKLLDSIHRFNIQQMEATVEELERCDYDAGGELVKWLREQIDNLEYVSMRERLERLLKKDYA